MTPRLSPLIPIPTKGDLRLVLDIIVPNQALERRRIQFPTVEDILHKMEGSIIFAEVDFSQGYLQISLFKESRPITAFHANCTRRRTIPVQRLIMSVSPSGEYFHKIIHDLIKHIPNCTSDYIQQVLSIQSKDITDHAKQLDLLLQTTDDSDLTLKFPKCGPKQQYFEQSRQYINILEWLDNAFATHSTLSTSRRTIQHISDHMSSRKR